MDIGDKVNKLTLISFAGRNKHRQLMGKFQCDCGETSKARVAAVSGGYTKSCGCLNHVLGKGSKYPPGIAAGRRLFTNYKNTAKGRGICFDLEIDHFLELTKSNCYYCGSPPSSVTSWWRKTTDPRNQYTYNGIDRKDNGAGYTKENSVPCCGKCNFAKKQMSPQEFIDHATKIASYWKAQSKE